MTEEEAIRKEYSLFAKELEKYELQNALYVIWAYSRNFDYNLSFPADIEVSNNIKNGKDFEKRANSWVEFELEYFVKELIIHCSQSQLIFPKSFKRQTELISIVNCSRKFRDFIDSIVSTPENVLLEIGRLAHQQFKWQIDIICKVVRYYKIYSSAGLDDIISNEFKVDTLLLYQYTITLNVAVSKQFRIPKAYFFTDKYKNYSQNFLAEIMTDIVSIKGEMLEANQIDKNHFFNYNPIVSKPILDIGNDILCPIPKLILLKLTDGLFYLLSNKKNFGFYYGKAFERYIGEVLSIAIKNAHYFGEIEFTKNVKSTDWHIMDCESLLFIECKTKRPKLASKSQAEMTEEWAEDLEKLTLALEQCANSYNKYLNGHYKTIEQELLKPYFMVVTLEDWFIELNKMAYELIKEQLVQRLKDKYSFILDVEFAIISVERFEVVAESIDSLGIADFFKKYSNNLIPHENTEKIVLNYLHEEYKRIFEPK